ncbi:hypothetical protein BKA80DRAFT_26356 [Phyllosticta citrichinensis]
MLREFFTNIRGQMVWMLRNYGLLASSIRVVNFVASPLAARIISSKQGREIGWVRADEVGWSYEIDHHPRDHVLHPETFQRLIPSKAAQSQCHT